MCMGEGCDVGAAITAYFLYLLVSAGTTAVWAIFVSVLAGSAAAVTSVLLGESARVRRSSLIGGSAGLGIYVVYRILHALLLQDFTEDIVQTAVARGDVPLPWEVQAILIAFSILGLVIPTTAAGSVVRLVIDRSGYRWRIGALVGLLWGMMAVGIVQGLTFGFRYILPNQGVLFLPDGRFFNLTPVTVALIGGIASPVVAAILVRRIRHRFAPSETS